MTRRLTDKDYWDGGCSRDFFVKCLALLAKLHGPRKIDMDSDELKALLGPLGGVEDTYLRLPLPDGPPLPIPEKVAKMKYNNPKSHI